jgi:Ca2+-binding RTX toxin-like protein
MAMAEFSFEAVLRANEEEALIGLTDLKLLQTGGTSTLFAVTRGDGWLTAFDTGSSPGRARIEGHYRIPASYLQLESTDLEWRSASGGPQLYMAGLAGTSLQAVTLDPAGSGSPFRSTSSLRASGQDLGRITEMEMIGANGAVVALRSGGLAELSFGASGTLGYANVSRPGPLQTARVADLATSQSGGQTFVFASYGNEDTVSMFRMQNGSLRHVTDVAAQDGLWVDRPGALTTARAADGSLYLIVAASGSDSLSVLRVSDNGNALVPVDHLLDGRDSRFANAKHVTKVTIADQDFILAAGNDQGLTLLMLLPGGRLQQVAVLEAPPEAPLKGITALEAMANADGLRVWVSTQAAPFLAEFHVDMANLGAPRLAGDNGGSLSGTSRDELLYGGRGADQIDGGGGDDILVDGGGVDRLTGGTGSDTFVLLKDEERDVVEDFDHARDRIDLTDFNQFDALGTLTILSRSWGAELRFGDEIVEVRSANGGRIAVSDLTEQNLLQGGRLETDPSRYETEGQTPVPDPDPTPDPDPDPTPTPDPEPEPDPTPTPGPNPGGNPGPNQTVTPQNPVGAPPAAPIWRGFTPEVLSPSAGDTAGSAGPDTLFGRGDPDRIFGGAGDDSIASGAAHDSVSGGTGDDTLHGGGESDVISGDAGDDMVTGGDGSDTLSGGDGADTLSGRDGTDTILGGNGEDRILGGELSDAAWGGAGQDRIYGGTGHDWLSADGNIGFSVDGVWGEAGNDTILGRSGSDMLSGGTGNDLLDGGAGADHLYGGDNADTLLGGHGNDKLHGNAGRDNLYGGGGDDTLSGGRDDDRLWGGLGNDRFYGGAGDDILDGGSGVDTLAGGAGSDTILGGAGDDVLAGNAAADIFIFAEGQGRDTVTDFDALNANEKLDFSAHAAFTSYAALMNAAVQDGADTVIDLGANASVTLLGVNRSDLGPEDFLF